MPRRLHNRPPGVGISAAYRQLPGRTERNQYAAPLTFVGCI